MSSGMLCISVDSIELGSFVQSSSSAGWSAMFEWKSGWLIGRFEMSTRLLDPSGAASQHPSSWSSCEVVENSSIESIVARRTRHEKLGEPGEPQVTNRSCQTGKTVACVLHSLRWTAAAGAVALD